MVAQGVLDFQYEADSSRQGLTSLAGLPVYLDLVKAIGLAEAIRRQVCVAGSQGWLDIQMVLAVVFLNLAGGDCVDDIERLERDGGFSAILRAIEKELLSRAERRAMKARWRRERERATPSPSSGSRAVRPPRTNGARNNRISSTSPASRNAPARCGPPSSRIDPTPAAPS